MQNQRRTKVWASRTGVAPKVNASVAGAAQKLGPQNWSCPKITVVRSEARAAQRFVHPELEPPKSKGIQNRSSPKAFESQRLPKVGASRARATQKLGHPEPEPPKSWGIQSRSRPKISASRARAGASQKLVHPEPELPKSWGIHNHYCSKRKGRWLRKTGFFSSSCINMVYIPPDSCSYKKNAIIEEKPVLFLQF